MQKKDSEKDIERELKKAVEKAGGLCIKFSSIFFTGMPDRFLFLPEGRFYMVELKSTSKTLEPRQKLVKKQLSRLGFTVYVLDTFEKLNAFINTILK